MVKGIGSEQYQRAREALRAAGERFAELVRSAPDPGAKVTAEWTAADMTAHVTAIAWMYTAMVATRETPPRIPALRDVIPQTTVDTVSAMNETTLANFPERDTGVLTTQLIGHIDEILQSGAGQDPERPIRWLGDSLVPLGGIVAHLLNELLVHGRDIARGIGAQWTIPPQDAAMFFDMFLVGVIRHHAGRLLDTGVPPLDRRIAVEFRSRHTTPVTLVLRAGQVTAEEPGPGADVRLSFDPATLNLVLFHRISKPRAAVTGRIVVRGGRRPWLLLPFLRKVRLPK